MTQDVPSNLSRRQTPLECGPVQAVPAPRIALYRPPETLLALARLAARTSQPSPPANPNPNRKPQPVANLRCPALPSTAPQP
jgi:hypothetical protein